MAADPACGPLFVYGTLRSGERNHGWLAGCRSLGPARTRAAWTLLDLGPFPALVAGGATAVLGERYEVPRGAWPGLDQLEECPAVFRRQRLELEGGLAAEAYVLPAVLGEGAPAISGGDWVTRSPRPAPGDRPPCFAELWARLPWRRIPGCPGRFVCPAGLGTSPEELVGRPLPAPTRVAACPDPVLAWAVPGGGILAYQRPDGWVLTLNDPEGFARKLRTLGRDLP